MGDCCLSQRCSFIILIDTLSFSCNGWFSSRMQAIGCAVIVGTPTLGGLTGLDARTLPNGGLLLYPDVQVVASDGTVLEGRGVIPDIAVPPDRALLLRSIESRLEAAIECIERQGIR